MTTPHKHAALTHAFADGKTLQVKCAGSWTDWTKLYCPRFFDIDQWRIKPDEPKKIIFFATVTNDGFLRWVKDGSYAHHNAIKGRLEFIPELDREVTLGGE